MPALPILTDSVGLAYIDQTIAEHNGRPGALLGILEWIEEHHRTSTYHWKRFNM